jgi:hypothetical protein
VTQLLLVVALGKSTGRPYRQNYVVFLRARVAKIAYMREFFDPIRAAWALDAPSSIQNPDGQRKAAFRKDQNSKVMTQNPGNLG